jgi:hypothetical protein
MYKLIKHARHEQKCSVLNILLCYLSNNAHLRRSMLHNKLKMLDQGQC